MQRLIFAAIVMAGMVSASTPANACWWRHRCGGWGGCGYGWGGYGYDGYGGYGWGGYPAYGYGGFRYRPFAVGYYPSYYASYSPSYGCSDYGCYDYETTVGLRYPTYSRYAASQNRSRSIIASASPVIRLKPSETAPKAPPPLVASDAPPSAIALQRFLGLKDVRSVALTAALPTTASRPTTLAARTLDDVIARFSNVESRRKADRLINEGDELFRAQNFHSALQKYKLAASTAPDLPEAHWRKAHALLATHNYDLATTAFKRAIALTEDFGRGGFRLSDLYGTAAMTKTNHLESLAERAIARSGSSDPYFLLGLFLYYDGQPARAEKFFQKAGDLAGISGGHIAAFLDPAEEATEAPGERTVRPAASLPVVPISAGVEL
jgi:hypothetical protein